MKRNENKSKIVTRGIKGAILALVMAVSGIMSPMTAYAGTTEYDKWDVDVIYSDEVKNAYGMMDAEANFSVHTNWYAFGHWVDSVGTSKVKWSTPSGYKGKLKSNSHKIVVKITGIVPNISFSDASTISADKSTMTRRSSSKNWKYHVYSECTSLVGYSEKHYGDVEIKRADNKTIETISVLSVLKY